MSPRRPAKPDVANATALFDKVVEAARGLPGVEEGTSYGTRALRVRDKFLARLREDNESLVIKVQIVERDHMLASDPRTFFTTDHYRDYPAILIHLSKVAPQALRELIEQSWRRAAPKRLVAEFDRLGAPGKGTLMRDEERPREDLVAELESLRRENARLLSEAADRAKVQEALRVSEERFFKAFHASPDVIVITTQSDARIVEVNPAIERIFGHTREEALGRTVVELGHWKNLPARDDMLHQLREHGEVRNFEVQFVSKSGAEGVCELSALPIELGGVPCLLSVIRDVTAQKATEQALRAETALLEGLMESLPGIFWVTDQNRNLRRWNARLERVSGKSAAEIAQLRGPDFIRPESRQALDHARQRILSEGEASVEVQVITADGSDVPYLLSASRVELAGEIYSVGVAIDITEQRQLKREVLEISTRERQRVGQDLHDGLGQQLTGIVFLSRALAQKLAAKGLPEADDVYAIQQRVTTALGQTRFLAWGLLPVSFDAAGLTATLEELAANATELFGLRCTVRVGDDVEVDNEETAAHLCHVAREAVTNAARHATASDVAIGIAQTDLETTLTVEDNGVGILPAGERQDGLGLRIMQYRAHLIGATLTVTRAEQRGTIVTCVLPRAGHIP